MSTLFLHLKKEWFEKIESGEKTVEYREVKDYWRQRLQRSVIFYQHGASHWLLDIYHGKIYTDVCFSLGYSQKAILRFAIDDIHVVDGKSTDLAISKPVYAIKLGRRL